MRERLRVGLRALGLLATDGLVFVTARAPLRDGSDELRLVSYPPRRLALQSALPGTLAVGT
jgi:hypothetical protein